MNRRIVLMGAVATLFVVTAFALWLFVLRVKDNPHDPADAPVVTEAPIDWSSLEDEMVPAEEPFGEKEAAEEIAGTESIPDVADSEFQNKPAALADVRLVEHGSNDIGVIRGLDYQVYYNEGSNVLSYNILNSGAEFIAFDSIIVLAGEDKTPKYAFYIHSLLHPPIGKSQFYEAYPEIPFEGVKYAGVVSAYHESVFKEANELVEKTYFAHFDPLVVGTVDTTQFNRGQQRTSSQWSKVDWSRLPTTRQKELIQLELDLMDELTLEELIGTLEDMFGDILDVDDEETGEGTVIETPEDLQDVVDHLSGGIYDLSLDPVIVVGGLRFSELSFDASTRQFIGLVENIGNSTSSSPVRITLLDREWRELASFVTGTYVPPVGESYRLWLPTTANLSIAKYVRLLPE